MFGKKVRLARLRNAKSGKMLTVAIDHAVSGGILPGIENLPETVESILSAGPDAVILHKGSVETCLKDYAGRVGVIMQTCLYSVAEPDKGVQVGWVEEAIEIGADAVATATTIYGKYEMEDLAMLGALVRDARAVGMPVVAHSYPRGSLLPDSKRHNPEVVARCVREPAEIGADIVKTFYTGDSASFSQIVRQCPAMVVVAGGPKMETPRDVFTRALEVMDSGAAGITFGRNIWQAESPARMVEALKLIIHEGKGLSETEKFYTT